MVLRPSASRFVLALLATFASAAAGGEAYFRLIRPVEYRRPTTSLDGTLWKSIVHRRSAIPGLDYEMKPGVHRTVNGTLVETNSLGQRDREPPTELAAPEFVIAAVGDSLTFGTKVAGEDAWPNALERLLAPPGVWVDRRFDVVNLGVSGYSAQDEALVVRHKALALSPRLLIIGYYLNDPETEPVQQLHQHFRAAHAWEHSALLRWIAFRARMRAQERLGGGDVFRYLHRDPESWQSVVRALADIAAATSKQEVSVLFVVLPTLRGFDRWEDYPYADLHAQAIEAARAAGFETLDVLPAWRESGRTPAELRADEEHPNAAGHAAIAAAVLAKLRATAMWSTPPSR
jgi:lysophospholipase L1-like esterase